MQGDGGGAPLSRHSATYVVVANLAGVDVRDLIDYVKVRAQAKLGRNKSAALQQGSVIRGEGHDYSTTRAFAVEEKLAALVGHVRYAVDSEGNAC